MEKIIINKVLKILSKNVINSLTDENIDYFLSGGVLGKSLFLYEYGNYIKDGNIIELANEIFEKVYLLLEDETYEAGMEFISGYAGIGWGFQYLCNNDFLDYDEDFFKLFDQVLLEQCKIAKETNNYDLFYGLLGYGNYFIQRNHFKKESVDKELNEIVDILLKMSVEDNNGVKWIDSISPDDSGIVNLGMAHGLSSIISFLSKVYSINGNLKAKKGVVKSVNWILSNKSKNSKSKSCFPNNIKQNEDSIEYTSRLAWCNGDLGIGYSVFVCGKIIKNNEFIEEGLSILRKTSIRKEKKETGILDRGFCHGTSGALHIYNKLINSYNLPEFLAIRDYWLHETIREVNGVLDISAFDNWCGVIEGKNQFTSDSGLLNGYSGIGLSLLSYLDKGKERKCSWDEIFLL